jgi:hypothetical protein
MRNLTQFVDSQKQKVQPRARFAQSAVAPATRGDPLRRSTTID